MTILSVDGASQYSAAWCRAIDCGRHAVGQGWGRGIAYRGSEIARGPHTDRGRARVRPSRPAPSRDSGASLPVTPRNTDRGYNSITTIGVTAM
jgi:hypothetical protein